MRYALLLALLFATSLYSFAGASKKDIETAKQIVNQWNNIHNTKQTEELNSLYASTIFFYGKYKPMTECIEKKAYYLNQYKVFKQELVSPIDVTAYSTGVLKCSFVKQVTYKQKLRTYNAYLLIEKRDDSYFIIGESDTETDKNTGVYPIIGTATNNSSNTTLVTVIIIVACIVACGAAYYFFRAKKKNTTTLTQASTKDVEATNTPPVYITPTSNEKPLDTKEKGEDFEKYIVERFDEAYFKLLEWRSDKFHDGKYAKSNTLPDLEYEFNTATYHNIKFAIECKWRKEFIGGKIEWAKDYQLENYKTYASNKNIPVFVMIGIGNQPSNPERMYIVPLERMWSTVVTEKWLEKYKRYKTTKFFFHAYNNTIE